jgi:hypothetical protein
LRCSAFDILDTTFILVFVRSDDIGKCEVKGKVVPVLLTEHDAMKAYWESGGIAPFIL